MGKKCNDRDYNGNYYDNNYDYDNNYYDNNYEYERYEGCRDIKVGIRFVLKGLEEIEERYTKKGIREIKKGLQIIKEGSRDLGCKY